MSFEEAVEYVLPEKEATSLPTVPQELPTSESPHVITRREEEVAALVAQDFTNRQIATELVISEHTVATHVIRIFNKLGLTSRAQVSAWMPGRLPQQLEARP